MPMLSMNACRSLVPASSRVLRLTNPCDVSTGGSFTFAIMADPQLGLLERYVECRPEPHYWDREIKLIERAVDCLNKLVPKPKFVMLCGDLADAPLGTVQRDGQIADLMKVLNKLDPEINVLALPGNHDVNDHPTEASLLEYTKIWGDDYYSFNFNNVEFLVLNSQLLWSDSGCKEASAKFEVWLREQFVRLQRNPSGRPIVFQHIPFFKENVDEPDNYFTIPKHNRLELLPQLYESGVRYMFSGHLHRNVTGVWPGPSDSFSDPMHLITSSSVCVQLGSDQPGLCFVHVDPSNAATASSSTVQSSYSTLDEMESAFTVGAQPVSF